MHPNTPAPETPFAINNIKGILWILLSVVSSSAMTIAVRGSALTLDSRMVVLLRSGITLVALTVVVILFSRWRRQLSFTKPWLHVTRGLMIAVSTHLGFYTIATLPLATATVLFFTGPIFATIISALVQNEHVGPRRIAAIIAGFVGALIILRPGVTEVHPAMLTALGSSVLFAAALIQSREIAEADGSFSALYSSVAFTVLISIPLAAPVFTMPTGWTAWGFVLLMVATGAIRNVADIEAYRFGEAAVLAPFSYLRLVLIGIAGYLIFGEVPDHYTIIGAIIIIAATFYIAHRERQLKRLASPEGG
jgi:drug/metabolite transporter (DMT)-like permease